MKSLSRYLKAGNKYVGDEKSEWAGATIAQAGLYFSNILPSISNNTKVCGAWMDICSVGSDRHLGFLVELIELAEYILLDLDADKRTPPLERAVYEMMILGLLQLDLARSNPKLYAWLTANEHKYAPREESIRELIIEAKGVMIDYDGSFNPIRTSALINKRRGRFIKCVTLEKCFSDENIVSIINGATETSTSVIETIVDVEVCEENVKVDTDRLVSILSTVNLKEAVIKFSPRKRSS